MGVLQSGQNIPEDDQASEDIAIDKDPDEVPGTIDEADQGDNMSVAGTDIPREVNAASESNNESKPISETRLEQPGDNADITVDRDTTANTTDNEPEDIKNDDSEVNALGNGVADEAAASEVADYEMSTTDDTEIHDDTTKITKDHDEESNTIDNETEEIVGKGEADSEMNAIENDADEVTDFEMNNTDHKSEEELSEEKIESEKIITKNGTDVHDAEEKIMKEAICTDNVSNHPNFEEALPLEKQGKSNDAEAESSKTSEVDTEANMETGDQSAESNSGMHVENNIRQSDMNVQLEEKDEANNPSVLACGELEVGTDTDMPVQADKLEDSPSTDNALGTPEVGTEIGKAAITEEQKWSNNIEKLTESTDAETVYATEKQEEAAHTDMAVDTLEANVEIDKAIPNDSEEDINLISSDKPIVNADANAAAQSEELEKLRNTGNAVDTPKKSTDPDTADPNEKQNAPNSDMETDNQTVDTDADLPLEIDGEKAKADNCLENHENINEVEMEGNAGAGDLVETKDQGSSEISVQDSEADSTRDLQDEAAQLSNQKPNENSTSLKFSETQEISVKVACSDNQNVVEEKSNDQPEPKDQEITGSDSEISEGNNQSSKCDDKSSGNVVREEVFDTSDQNNQSSPDNSKLDEGLRQEVKDTNEPDTETSINGHENEVIISNKNAVTEMNSADQETEEATGKDSKDTETNTNKCHDNEGEADKENTNHQPSSVDDNESQKRKVNIFTKLNGEEDQSKKEKNQSKKEDQLYSAETSSDSSGKQGKNVNAADARDTETTDVSEGPTEMHVEQDQRNEEPSSSTQLDTKRGAVNQDHNDKQDREVEMADKADDSSRINGEQDQSGTNKDANGEPDAMEVEKDDSDDIMIIDDDHVEVLGPDASKGTSDNPVDIDDDPEEILLVLEKEAKENAPTGTDTDDQSGLNSRVTQKPEASSTTSQLAQTGSSNSDSVTYTKLKEVPDLPAQAESFSCDSGKTPEANFANPAQSDLSAQSDVPNVDSSINPEPDASNRIEENDPASTHSEISECSSETSASECIGSYQTDQDTSFFRNLLLTALNRAVNESGNKNDSRQIPEPNSSITDDATNKDSTGQNDIQSSTDEMARSNGSTELVTAGSSEPESNRNGASSNIGNPPRKTASPEINATPNRSTSPPKITEEPNKDNSTLKVVTNAPSNAHSDFTKALEGTYNNPVDIDEDEVELIVPEVEPRKILLATSKPIQDDQSMKSPSPSNAVPADSSAPISPNDKRSDPQASGTTEHDLSTEVIVPDINEAEDEADPLGALVIADDDVNQDSDDEISVVEVVRPNKTRTTAQPLRDPPRSTLPQMGVRTLLAMNAVTQLGCVAPLDKNRAPLSQSIRSVSPAGIRAPASLSATLAPAQSAAHSSASSSYGAPSDISASTHINDAPPSSSSSPPITNYTDPSSKNSSLPNGNDAPSQSAAPDISDLIDQASKTTSSDISAISAPTSKSPSPCMSDIIAQASQSVSLNISSSPSQTASPPSSTTDQPFKTVLTLKKATDAHNGTDKATPSNSLPATLFLTSSKTYCNRSVQTDPPAEDVRKPIFPPGITNCVDLDSEDVVFDSRTVVKNAFFWRAQADKLARAIESGSKGVQVIGMNGSRAAQGKRKRDSEDSSQQSKRPLVSQSEEVDLTSEEDVEVIETLSSRIRSTDESSENPSANKSYMHVRSLHDLMPSPPDNDRSARVNAPDQFQTRGRSTRTGTAAGTSGNATASTAIGRLMIGVPSAKAAATNTMTGMTSAKSNEQIFRENKKLFEPNPGFADDQVHQVTDSMNNNNKGRALKRSTLAQQQQPAKTSKNPLLRNCSVKLPRISPGSLKINEPLGATVKQELVEDIVVGDPLEVNSDMNNSVNVSFMNAAYLRSTVNERPTSAIISSNEPMTRRSASKHRPTPTPQTSSLPPGPGRYLQGCKKCAFSTKSTAELNSHVVMEHGGEGLFLCFKCPFATSEGDQLREHMIQAHPEFSAMLDKARETIDGGRNNNSNSNNRSSRRGNDNGFNRNGSGVNENGSTIKGYDNMLSRKGLIIKGNSSASESNSNRFSRNDTDSAFSHSGYGFNSISSGTKGASNVFDSIGSGFNSSSSAFNRNINGSNIKGNNNKFNGGGLNDTRFNSNSSSYNSAFNNDCGLNRNSFKDNSSGFNSNAFNGSVSSSNTHSERTIEATRKTKIAGPGPASRTNAWSGIAAVTSNGSTRFVTGAGLSAPTARAPQTRSSTEQQQATSNPTTAAASSAPMKYPCKSCAFATNSPLALKQHIEANHIKLFECELCSFRHVDERRLENHIATAHLDDARLYGNNGGGFKASSSRTNANVRTRASLQASSAAASSLNGTMYNRNNNGNTTTSVSKRSNGNMTTSLNKSNNGKMITSVNKSSADMMGAYMSNDRMSNNAGNMLSGRKRSHDQTGSSSIDHITNERLSRSSINTNRNMMQSFCCDTCPFMAPNKDELREHVRMAHSAKKKANTFSGLVQID